MFSLSRIVSASWPFSDPYFISVSTLQWLNRVVSTTNQLNSKTKQPFNIRPCNLTDLQKIDFFVRHISVTWLSPRACWVSSGLFESIACLAVVSDCTIVHCVIVCSIFVAPVLSQQVRMASSLCRFPDSWTLKGQSSSLEHMLSLCHCVASLHAWLYWSQVFFLFFYGSRGVLIRLPLCQLFMDCRELQERYGETSASSMVCSCVRNHRSFCWVSSFFSLQLPKETTSEFQGKSTLILNYSLTLQLNDSLMGHKRQGESVWVWTFSEFEQLMAHTLFCMWNKMIPFCVL